MFAAGALSLSAQIHVVEYLGNSKTLVNASKTDSITFAPPATSGTSAGYSSINLVQWDNSVVSFELGNHPKVTWDSQINISTDKAIVSYSFTKIRCIKPDMSTGINATTNEAGKMAFRVDGNTLTVSGMKKNEKLTIYTVEGKRVATAVAKDNIPVNVNLATGIYVARTSRNVSFKIKTNQ